MLVLAIVFMLASLLVVPDGVGSLLALRRERQRLGEEAVALLEQNDALREQIHRLRTDDRFLEELARRDGLLLLLRFNRCRLIRGSCEEFSRRGHQRCAGAAVAGCS